MRYEGDVIKAPEFHTEIRDGQLFVHGNARIGFGQHALVLPPGVRVKALKLMEQLVIEGFDLPAGATQYGDRIYLRNVTPVLHPISLVGDIEVEVDPPAVEPESAGKGKAAGKAKA